METNTQYLEIRLPAEQPYSSYEFKEPRVIGKLSQINLFIGANNSGKSRLLRYMFRLNDYEYTANNYTAVTFRDFINSIKKDFDTIFSGLVVGIGKIKKSCFDELLRSDDRFIAVSNPINIQLESMLADMKNPGSGLTMSLVSTGHEEVEYRSKLDVFAVAALDKYNGLFRVEIISGEKHFYIPILRGMRPLSDSDVTSYEKRTIQDYFPGLGEKEKNLCVFTGLELYKSLKKKKLGMDDDYEIVTKYEQYLSKNFFDGKPIRLVPYEDDNVVHIKIGDEKQLPIYHLGDGLQNLIIITYNMFMETNRCLFFIEEPDLCMHPGLQRALLRVMSDLKHHQYFISTHSNHLLDMTLDFNNISVFAFSKAVKNKETTFRVNLATSRDFNILRELGVLSSSVFITNSTIWVEGITDRLYIRAYMKKYIEELFKTDRNRAKELDKFKEDYHYSFVEYQGSTLSHWTFDPEENQFEKIKATYLCSAAFLIADGDIVGKGDRKTVYTKMMGDRCNVLDCKEIENLLPVEILKGVVKNKFEKHGADVDSIKYVEYCNSKNGLGKYLDGKLPQGGQAFSSDTGSIANKVKFCEDAIAIMDNSDTSWTLPTQISELCKKIFEHIEKYNA